MESFEKLAEKQTTTGAEIQRIIRNFKKDSQERKNIPYYEERKKLLIQAYDEFEETDTQMRTHEDFKQDHEYFAAKFYDKIIELSHEHIEIFDKEIQRMKVIAETSVQTKGQDGLPAKVNNKKGPMDHAALNGHNSSSQQPEINHRGLIRKLTARMATLNRSLQDLSTDSNKPRQFYKVKIETLKRQWDQIQDLHDEAIYTMENPTEFGLNNDEYNNLDEFLQQRLVELTIQADRYETNNAASNLIAHNTTTALPLPKVTIPRFNGDYLKWKPFHDLFSEIVDKQPLPQVQKMWYLKANISGEAETLIGHLGLTEGNYLTAWTLLKERYNNKRIQVASLVEKIINQPAGTSSIAAVKGLHDTTKECLLAINSIGIDTKAWDPLLIQLLIKKLDKATHIRFEQSLENPKEVPKIMELLSFLEMQFQSMEAVGQKEKTTSSRAVSSVVTSDKNNNNCKLCRKEPHPLYFCYQFTQMSPTERLRWVQQQRLCVNCFKSNHITKNCMSRGCKKCGKKHNSLLHLENHQTQNLPNQQQPPRQLQNDQPRSSSSQPSQPCVPNSNSGIKVSSSNATAVTSASTNAAAARQGYVFLATARVIITAQNGQSDEFRAIFDSGSQINVVSERLIKRLSITPTEASLYIDGIGKTQKKATQRVNIQLHSMQRNFATNLEAFVLPTIIPPQPHHEVDVSTWPIPPTILHQLADPAFNQPGKVDILLGAEFYFSLATAGKIKLADNLPFLLNTELGWIVGGQAKINQELKSPTCAILPVQPVTNKSLEESIEKLWKLDEVLTSEKVLSPEERQCESHFIHNVRTDELGRFIVSLPFRENPAALGDSHTMAYNRFMSLERRFVKNKEIQRQYVQFMQEYENLGHMQEVSLDTVLKPNYFIPHHCVLKPDSTTTRLRVVFDASAKTATGCSLNDLMYTGPRVQSELFSILLRFRLPRFVFTTDIEKMYRQILVAPADKNFQLILWRSSQNDPVKCYKLNTVTYGTSSAPYLATRCLQQISNENAVNYPFGSQMLRDNFYVDDGLGGSDNLNVAIATQKELITILKRHGFNLRKWCANHPQLLKNIPIGDQEVNLDFNSEGNNSTIKTLGLFWLPRTDHFCVKTKLDPVQIVSKRTATSDLAKLFDPLGLLAPVVVRVKIFIQKLWQQKIDWDDKLPSNLENEWITFRQDIENLNNLQIPRHIFKAEIPVNTQLHIFADASERAFGAAAYIRATLKQGTVIVQLLCAKTRVAPLKQQTLPRLELCAAVLAAQLANRIKTDTQVKDQPIFLWTDSEIVLAWINAQSGNFKTFVANRIATIQTLTLPDQWRHVRSKDNPADILSRGLPASQLSACGLWFHGPLFLHGNQELWPQRFATQLQISTDLEKKKTVAVSSLTAAENVKFNIYNIKHRNSFIRLQKIVGYILRFAKNTRILKINRPTSKALNPDELNEALFVIIQGIQVSDFAAEIKQLQKHKEVDTKSSISSLSPFLDERGILRVGGRLESSTLPYDAKHPMLIPYNDPLIKLLCIMIHEENKHCGPQALLGIMRQRFWPIKGKTMTRAVVQKCVRCTRARPQLCQQIMGNLPQARVTPARPFINAGVDFCGPFWIHYKVRGKRPTKAYIAVFCCFATKAVHLELVTDLSTDAFIGALKRFIGRRGRCQHIYSDNATNFVGAKNQLLELVESIHSEKGREAIITASSAKGIHFHFIPPRAPHFGGLWEAAVKSAKHLLLRSVAPSSLTQEELETVVVEIEAILNSRPLTPISNDPSSLEALTPGHFLIGEPLTAQIDYRANTINTSVLSHWQLVSKLKHVFWKRWSTEYLNELQQRQKWRKQFANLKKGDLVIIKEDNVPVMRWPLGRIMEVHLGDDGAARVAEVKTATGVFKRAIHRLALLPVEDDSQATAMTNDQQTNSKISESNEKLNQEPENEPIKEPDAKRRKTPTNHLLLTLITTILILPIVLGTPVENKKFGTKLGIHFEGLGSTTISTTEWNLLVYYDLDNYWSETSALINGTKSLNNLCKIMKPNFSCLSVIQHFQQLEAELRLDNRLLQSKRSKRGAFDLVGNIAHSLFGVLDSEYANQISNTIQQVKENESFLLKLLQNQTSIVDSTLNIIKQNQIETKTKFEHLDNEVRAVSEGIRDINDILVQIHLTQIFNSGVLQLTLVANNLQRVQSSILDTLTESHHGKISPLLLTPKQLQNEVDKIRLHSPTSADLPISKNDDLIRLYMLMSVKGGVTHKHVIFKITLPLVEPEIFEIYSLVPVPNRMNGSMVAIKSCSPILAINNFRRQYILLNKSEFSSCYTIKQEVYLCSNVQIRYNYGADICGCEINLFNNKSTPTCALENIGTKDVWKPLHQENQWIYATLSSSRATAVCNRDIIPLTLKGSGLLTLEPECVLKHNFATMNGRQRLSNTLRSSYTSLGKISELSSQVNKNPLTINNNNLNSTRVEELYAKNLQDIKNLQNMLNQHKLADLPNKLQVHKEHSYAVGYLALVLSFVTLVTIIYKYNRKRSTRELSSTTEEVIETQSIQSEAPIPNPRSYNISV